MSLGLCEFLKPSKPPDLLLTVNSPMSKRWSTRRFRSTDNEEQPLRSLPLRKTTKLGNRPRQGGEVRASNKLGHPHHHHLSDLLSPLLDPNYSGTAAPARHGPSPKPSVPNFSALLALLGNRHNPASTLTDSVRTSQAGAWIMTNLIMTVMMIDARNEHEVERMIEAKVGRERRRRKRTRSRGGVRRRMRGNWGPFLVWRRCWMGWVTFE